MSEGGEIDVAKLKRAIVDNTGPGRPFTRRGLSLMATGGKNPDLVRDMLGRGQDKRVSFQVAAGIAKALNLDVQDFIIGKRPTGGIRDTVKVKGDVQAGVWREQAEWSDEEQFDVEVLPLAFDAVRFGLRVVGYSMDKVFLPGQILDCVRVGFGLPGPAPKHRDIVVVQRRQGSLFETTCKQLEIVDGEYWLRPLSTRPEFQEAFSIGRPDPDHYGDEAIEIIGIVITAMTQVYQP